MFIVMRTAFFHSFSFRASTSASVASVLTALFLLSGCGNKEGASAPGGPGAKPPPEVGVITTSLQAVALQTELPGRVDPLRVAQVRARDWHRFEAPVPRRQRSQGWPGAVSDRPGAVSGGV